MAIYLAIQLSYCFGLKHQAVLDIVIVSSGFLIGRSPAASPAASRCRSGSCWSWPSDRCSWRPASATPNSSLPSAQAPKIRKSLENYTSTYLRFVWTLSATSVVLCYGLWAFEQEGTAGSWFVVSMIPFTVAILRYAVDVDGGLAGEPEEIALRDRVLQLLALAWIGTRCGHRSRLTGSPHAGFLRGSSLYSLLTRLSLWVSVGLISGLWFWGAWQRRWIADDGLIVLRTVRNLLAGNGPVFNVGERVESNTSTAWTYLVYLGSLVGGPVRLEYVALALSLMLSVAGVAMVMLGAARLWAPSLAGRRAVFVPAGALVYIAIPPARDFATSGLENGLVTAWLGLLWWMMVCWSQAPAGDRGRGDRGSPQALPSSRVSACWCVRSWRSSVGWRW